MIEVLISKTICILGVFLIAILFLAVIFGFEDSDFIRALLDFFKLLYGIAIVVVALIIAFEILKG